MTAPDSALIEVVEDELSRLPTVPDLDPAQESVFRRRRARIHQRYNEWRRGMPAIDGLFDGDEQRAKALAGSLATELERTLELYGELTSALDPAPDWPHRMTAEWCPVARRLADGWAWSDEANAVFEAVLEDLSAQAVGRAEAGERPLAHRSQVQVSGIRRLGIMTARMVMRFFRPPPATR